MLSSVITEISTISIMGILKTSSCVMILLDYNVLRMQLILNKSGNISDFECLNVEGYCSIMRGFQKPADRGFDGKLVSPKTRLLW
jgi:hypothetical protein